MTRPPLTPAELYRLRTRTLAAADALIRHIGAICAACRERLAHPSIPEDEAAIIEDCAFAAMPACRRRRAIREGWARCPLKLWTING
jgi:hypothetical protein